MDRGTRQILNSKAVKSILQMGAPAIRDGAEGDERVSKVTDGIRLYRKALGQWWYVKLTNSKASVTIPIATAILLGGIKVGSGLSITTDGVLSSTGSYSHPNHSGDVTSSGDGATAIASGVIIDDDVKSDASIAYSKLGSIPTWNQSTTGNANTVTTNANLTGAVTSVGNATSITAFASNTLADSSLPTTSGYAGVFKNLTAQSLQFYSLKAGTGVTLDKNNGVGEADTYIEISTSGFTTLAYKKIIAQTATGSDPDDSLFILAEQAEDTLTIGGGTTGVTTNAVFSTDTIEINVSKDGLFNLSSVGLVKRTGTNTYAIDASSYLTGITKSQVEAVLTGSISSHTHSYDNYGDWNLWVNGSAVKDVTSTNNVKFEAGQGISLAYLSDVVTITSSSIFNGLTDPDADKIPYWNDSTGIGGWITLDSSLSLSGSTLSASLSSVNRFVSVIDDGVTAYTAEDVDNQIKISGGSGINSSASQAGAVVTVILTADFGTSSTQVMAGNTLSAQDKTDIGNLSNTNSGDVCTSNHTSAGYSTGAHLAIGTSGGTALEGDTIVTNWSGASSGLTPATGRTSLELGTMAQQNTGSYATGAHLAIGTTSSTALAGNTAYSTLALGTSSSTAFRGDYGNSAYNGGASRYSLPSTVIHESELSNAIDNTSTTTGANLAGVKLAYDRAWQTVGNYMETDHEANNITATHITVLGNTTGTNSGNVCTSNHTSAGYITSIPSNYIQETELSSSVSSTATTTGANLAGVKSAYDRAWATVDHTHSAYLTTSSASSTYLPLGGGNLTGHVNLGVNYGLTGSSAPDYPEAMLELQTSSNYTPAISFHRGGYSATTLYEYDGRLFVNAWVSRAQTGELLTTGNYSSYALPKNASFTSTVNQNSGFQPTFDNDSTGTNAYCEQNYICGTRNIVIGCTHNYSSAQWNRAYVYVQNGDLGIKTVTAGYDIQFYAGDDSTIDGFWDATDGSLNCNNDLNVSGKTKTNGLSLYGGTASTSYPIRSQQTSVHQYLRIESTGNYEAMINFSNATVGDWYVGARNTNTDTALHFYNGDDVLLLGRNAEGGHATFKGDIQIGNYSSARGLTIAGSQDATQYIRFNDNNNTEGTYIKSIGKSGGGTIYIGRRWNTDTDVFNIDTTTGGAYFSGKVKITPSGYTNLHELAVLNIGYSGGGETRMIDLRGNWGGGENKTINAPHGGSDVNLVGSIKFQHDSPGSRISFGRIYHGGDQSSWPVEIISTGASATLSCTGDIVAYYSDALLKNFHGVIENPLDKVMKLNGYYFTENAKAKELGYNNDRMQVGVSAQEVEAVLPELIIEAPIGHGYKTIDYGKLTPLLIEAIKELKNEINQLKGINNG